VLMGRNRTVTVFKIKHRHLRSPCFVDSVNIGGLRFYVNPLKYFIFSSG